MLRDYLSAEDRAVLLRRHLDEGIPLTRLAAVSCVPIRTLRRWMSRYQDAGTVASLERRPHRMTNRISLQSELHPGLSSAEQKHLSELSMRESELIMTGFHRRLSAGLRYTLPDALRAH